MSFDRAQLTEDYIQHLIEGMDYKTMECLVYDTLKENLSSYTDAELLTEVEEYYPEMLEDVTPWVVAQGGLQNPTNPVDFTVTNQSLPSAYYAWN